MGTPSDAAHTGTAGPSRPDTQDRPPPSANLRDRIRTLHAHPHAWWVEAILVFLLIRLLGVLTLTRMATLHSETLRSRLAVWDGEWMLSIAAHGYGGVPATLTDAYGVHTADTAYAFFPGYPYLVGAVARLPLVSPFGAAIGVNVVLGCLAAVGAARLGHLCATQMSGRSPIGAADPRATGLFLVALFAATPMSVVLNMAYTEALFCALAVWALVGVLEGRWLLAGVMTLFAGTCRPTSVVLIGVVMLAAIIALVRRDEPRAWFAVILAPLGYLGYLSVVWAQTGSPTGWFEVQKDGWDTSLDFGVAAYRFVNDTLGDSDVVAHTATAMVILASIVMVGVAVWARMPWPVLVYGTLVVVSILISTGLMMSRPRLLLPAFVLLVPLAMALARVRRGLGVALLVPIVLGSSWFGAHMLTVFPNAI